MLLSEVPMNPKHEREKSVRIMFETFGVPALYVCDQAVLTLYAWGNTTGLVVESGHGVTHTVPIFDGYAQSHAIRRLDVAGRDITQCLLKMLKTKCFREKRHAPDYFKLNVAMYDLRRFKEAHCFVARDYQPASHCADVDFELPDGQRIKIGNERFRCAERLFKPSLIDGKSRPGIHQMVYDSAMACHVDIRRELCARTVLGGGTTMFPGFGARLTHELRMMRMPSKVTRHREYSAFVGGCILSSLSDFEEEMCITTDDYDECGPKVVNRKCF